MNILLLTIVLVLLVLLVHVVFVRFLGIGFKVPLTPTCTMNNYKIKHIIYEYEQTLAHISTQTQTQT
jgi:hypothetical protein